MELSHNMNPKRHTRFYKKTLSLLLALAITASIPTTAFGLYYDDEEEDEEDYGGYSLRERMELRKEEEERRANGEYWDDEEYWDDYWSEDLNPDEEYSGAAVSTSQKATVSTSKKASTVTTAGTAGTSGSKSITVNNNAKKTSSKTPTTVSNMAASIKNYQAKNSDVKAWLKVSGTNINYPVLKSPNGSNTYYEAKGLDKKYSKDGVIWADYGVNFGDSSTLTQNTCIFGHNWTNSWRTAYVNRAKDVMFAQLVPLKKLDFAQKNQKIYYSTEYEDMTFQIFAVFICNANDLDYVPSTYTTKQFSNLIAEARSLSFFDYDTTVTTSDKLITLSTCIDAYYKNGVRQTNQRFVVMGKLVKGTDATKDVTVTKNTDAKTPTGMGTRKDK
jgi:sortase B